MSRGPAAFLNPPLPWRSKACWDSQLWGKVGPPAGHTGEKQCALDKGVSSRCDFSPYVSSWLSGGCVFMVGGATHSGPAVTLLPSVPSLCFSSNFVSRPNTFRTTDSSFRQRERFLTPTNSFMITNTGSRKWCRERERSSGLHLQPDLGPRVATSCPPISSSESFSF